jgi:hypothetical protein
MLHDPLFWFPEMHAFLQRYGLHLHDEEWAEVKDLGCRCRAQVEPVRSEMRFRKIQAAVSARAGRLAPSSDPPSPARGLPGPSTRRDAA